MSNRRRPRRPIPGLAPSLAGLPVHPDDGLEVLPCGCRCGISEAEKAFIVVPCSPDCPSFAYIRAETARGGKPITYGTELAPEFTDAGIAPDDDLSHMMGRAVVPLFESRPGNGGHSQLVKHPAMDVVLEGGDSADG